MGLPSYYLHFRCRLPGENTKRGPALRPEQGSLMDSSTAAKPRILSVGKPRDYTQRVTVKGDWL